MLLKPYSGFFSDKSLFVFSVLSDQKKIACFLFLAVKKECFNRGVAYANFISLLI
jgi:hypothetical protein